ncbi:MAG: DsbA family protein [Hyphomicrobium sp.]|nr:DsbA family protein [Hyphomicrobium sp.]
MTKTLIALLFLSTASIATVITTGESGESSAPTTPAPVPSQGAELNRAAFTEDKVAPMVKPDKYDLTIVEYTDYQCPFCKKVHPELQKLLASDKKIRLIYRDWPIFGEQSVAAARVAIASNYQGKHAQVHDALMKTPRPLSDQSIRAAVTKAGADWTRLQTDMKKNAAEIDALLERNNEQAESLGLQGTPAFIIGNYLSEGGLDYDGLKAAVHEARTKPNPPLKPAPQPEGI